MVPKTDDGAVELIFRRESGRAVATLTRLFGDIDIAEEAVQEAFVTATSRWREMGIPMNPGGWIVTTAKNKALDRIRRESTRGDRHVAALLLHDNTDQAPEDRGSVEDDRLRLIFTCCHPALAPETQIALTLRLLAGLQTTEIARAFLVPEATMAQRLVRAKHKIRDAGIPYRVPQASELPSRIPPVLAVVYLIFNEGYAASHGDDLVRSELCEEAVRLARLLAALMPDELEVTGLLALLLLIDARRPARTTRDGSLVVLAAQDRSRWDTSLIAEGLELVRDCLRRNRPGPYQIQAAINAVHCDARSAESTDWIQILQLYDQLLALAPTPVVALNRSVAVAEVDGPGAALQLVSALRLDGYHPYHATRADLLRRLGRSDEARVEYLAALANTSNESERGFLEERLRVL
ncbi:MAG TPA: RNA polymerase sigma factor [Acidimicrobiales bacterium]